MNVSNASRLAIPLTRPQAGSITTLTDRDTNHVPQRQFAMVVDGRLQEAPTVRQLRRQLDPHKARDTCESVLVRFLGDRALYALPVIDDAGAPAALVDRKQFIEFFSRPYTREIFGRQTISELLDHEDYTSCEPIVVEETCNVEDVARIIIDAGMHHMVTGFLVSSGGRYVGVANGHDLLNIITQRKQAELYYLAHYDNLTGIPNRMLLGDRLEQACREAERKGSLAALLFIDVDRFKQINDSRGHSAGDAILRKVVDRLRDAARRSDTVARLAGDEFVVLMEDFTDPADDEMVAQRQFDTGTMLFAGHCGAGDALHVCSGLDTKRG